MLLHLAQTTTKECKSRPATASLGDVSKQHSIVTWASTDFASAVYPDVGDEVHLVAGVCMGQCQLHKGLHLEVHSLV